MSDEVRVPEFWDRHPQEQADSNRLTDAGHKHQVVALSSYHGKGDPWAPGRYQLRCLQCAQPWPCRTAKRLLTRPTESLKAVPRKSRRR